MDQLQQLMQVYDLAALRDYWSYLERRLFSRLEDIYRPTINKLKTSLFRFYLVYTIQVLVTAILLWLGRQSLDPQTLLVTPPEDYMSCGKGWGIALVLRFFFILKPSDLLPVCFLSCLRGVGQGMSCLPEVCVTKIIDLGG